MRCTPLPLSKGLLHDRCPTRLAPAAPTTGRRRAGAAGRAGPAGGAGAGRAQPAVHRQQLPVCGRLATPALARRHRDRPQPRRRGWCTGAGEGVPGAGRAGPRRLPGDARRQRPGLPLRAQAGGAGPPRLGRGGDARLQHARPQAARRRRQVGGLDAPDGQLPAAAQPAGAGAPDVHLSARRPGLPAGRCLGRQRPVGHGARRAQRLRPGGRRRAGRERRDPRG